MMHGLRLRYITLGLVVYIRNVFSDLCGPGSVNMASLAARSPTVFEGLAAEARPLPGDTTGLYRVRFTVQRLHRGSIGPGPTGTRSAVAIGRFGAVDPRDDCVTPIRKPPSPSNIRTRRTKYLVFLNGTGRPDPLVDPSDGTNLTGSDFAETARARNVSVFYYYEISDFPENSSSANRSRARVSSSSASSASSAAAAADNESSNAVQLISDNMYAVVGEKLTVQCKVFGRRTNVLWYRNGTVLKKGKRFRIHYKKSISTLSIRKAKLSDAGIYHCKLSNTSQESEKVTVEIYITHTRPCGETNYCLNRGKCGIMVGLGTKVCTCQKGFTGDRCQEKKTGIHVGKKRKRRGHPHHS